MSLVLNNFKFMHTAESFRNLNSYIEPQEMLRQLISTRVGECDCNESSRPTQTYRSQQQLEVVIESLHSQLESMNHEVIEAESLMNQRDMLYNQLDHLRAERQEIEDEINSQQFKVENQTKIKIGKGVREMNDRLRRRIREIKEYIDKMELQNKKIQEVLVMNSQQNNQQNNQQVHSYTEYGGSCNPTWMQRMNDQPSTTNSRKANFDYFNNLKKRLQAKEEQAWYRVRRQQQEIQNRNALSQMHLGYRTGYANPRRMRQYY